MTSDVSPSGSGAGKDDAIESPHAEIDALIAAFYGAFDNRGASKPATDSLRGMFAAHGRVVRVSAGVLESWSVDEFIAPREAMLSNGTLVEFHEWETDCATTVLGDIACRQSRYEKAGVLNGAAWSGKGQKLIQLCRDGGRWLIVSVLWEDLDLGG